MRQPAGSGTWRCITWACFAFIMAADRSARAEVPPESIESGIRATAILEVNQRGLRKSGTAFCMAKSGLFITSSHVVSAPPGVVLEITIVVEPGRPGQRRLPAKVVRDSPMGAGLALLKVEADPRFEPLAVGRDEAIRQNARIASFGFPLSRLSPDGRGVAPQVTVSKGQVTSLLELGGKIRDFGFEDRNASDEGFAGGPVLDERGHVVGVVGLADATGLARAVPAGVLDEFVEPPLGLLDSPKLHLLDRWKPTTWSIRVASTTKPNLPEGLKVTLVVGRDDQPARRIDAVPAGGGLFTVKFTPIALDPSRVIRMKITGEGGVGTSVDVLDTPIRVGGRELLLGDLGRIDVRMGRFLPDFGIRPGPITGLDQVRTARDRRPIPQLAKATMIDLAGVGPGPPLGVLVAKVELRQGDRVVATSEDTVPFAGGDPTDLAKRGPVEGTDNPAIPSGPGKVDSRGSPPPGPAPFITQIRTPVTGPTADDALVRVGGPLRTSDIPRGAARDLSPAHAGVIPEAMVVKETPPSLRPATPLIKFPTNGDNIYSLAFSPDGKALAVGGDDDLIRLLDPDNGQEIDRLRQESWVQGITFSADGKTIVTASFDARINAWNLATRQRSHPARDESLKTDSVSATADGRRAVALYRQDDGGQGESWTAKLWDLARGETLLSMPIRGKRVFANPSGDGACFLLVASPVDSNGDKPTFRLIDATAGVLKWSVEGTGGESVLAAGDVPGGETVASFASNNVVTFRSRKTGEVVRRITLIGSRIPATTGAVFSPDGRRLATKHESKSLALWDLGDGKRVAFLNLADEPGTLCFSPDGSKVAFGSFRATGGIWSVPPAPPGADAALARMLGGRILDVVAGGGGRYLVVLLAKPSRIAVFDARSGEVTKTIPLTPARTMIAAGAERFVVIDPDTQGIRQFDFKDFGLIPGPSESPVRVPIRLAAMGSDSDGPLLVGWTPNGGNPWIEPMRFTFIDLKSMKALKIGPSSSHGHRQTGDVAPGGGSFTIGQDVPGKEAHARASGDGTLFAFCAGNAWANGFNTAKIRGGGLRMFDHPNAHGYLAPGPVGSVVYLGSGGRRDPEFVPIGPEVNPGPSRQGLPTGGMLVPSADPSLYLDLAIPAPAIRHQEIRRAHATLSVHRAGDGRRLLSVVGLEELDELQVASGHDELTTEKRVHFIPAAHLLLTIPPTDDRLVLRKLDLESSLRKLGTGHLIGSSPARVAIAAGRPLAYQATARSDAGGLRWKLESGPDGLTVNPDGLVTWPSPRSTDGRPVPVVLKVVDASGNEAIHRFEVVIP